jgi:hypothetical protein
MDYLARSSSWKKISVEENNDTIKHTSALLPSHCFKFLFIWLRHRFRKEKKRRNALMYICFYKQYRNHKYYANLSRVKCKNMHV